MLTAATDPDDAATAAKLAAILEEPPRGGNSDLGAAFARQQPNWQRGRSSFEAAGQPRWSADAQRLAPALAPAFVDRIARRRGQEGRYQLANGMGRCWTPTMRSGATNG